MFGPVMRIHDKIASWPLAASGLGVTAWLRV